MQDACPLQGQQTGLQGHCSLLPVLGQGSQGTAKLPDHIDIAAYMQGEEPGYTTPFLMCLSGLRKDYRRRTARLKMRPQSLKSTPKRWCVSPQLKTLSAPSASGSWLLAVKYAGIKFIDIFSSEYFPLQQTMFKLSLVIDSFASETQSPNISVQEKYFFSLQSYNPLVALRNVEVYTFLYARPDHHLKLNFL